MTKLFEEGDLEQGAQIIKKGGIVAFPTETVYGLGADATNEKAVSRIFEAKGRPAKNPLIVHFESLEDLYMRIPNMDLYTKKVLSKIKTALTVIVSRPDWIPSVVSAGLDTVAVRVPSCKFARDFIKACGTPIAAPSANSSGRPSPTRWQHVYIDLKGKIDAVFMCDPVQIGVESTVIKIQKKANQKGKASSDSAIIKVLRLGGTNTLELEKKTGYKVEVVKGKDAKESPGTNYKHYAPTCPMAVARYGEDMQQRIKEFIKGKKATVIYWTNSLSEYISVKNHKAHTSVVFLGNDTKQIIRNLFSSIRAAEFGSDVIVCEGFPDTAEYETINERISRASEGKYI